MTEAEAVAASWIACIVLVQVHIIFSTHCHHQRSIFYSIRPIVQHYADHLLLFSQQKSHRDRDKDRAMWIEYMCVCKCMMYLPIRPMFPCRCLVYGDLFGKNGFSRFDSKLKFSDFRLEQQNSLRFSIWIANDLLLSQRNSYSPRSTSSMVGSNSFSSSVGKKLWFLQFSAWNEKKEKVRIITKLFGWVGLVEACFVTIFLVAEFTIWLLFLRRWQWRLQNNSRTIFRCQCGRHVQRFSKFTQNENNVWSLFPSIEQSPSQIVRHQ